MNVMNKQQVLAVSGGGNTLEFYDGMKVLGAMSAIVSFTAVVACLTDLPAYPPQYQLAAVAASVVIVPITGSLGALAGAAAYNVGAKIMNVTDYLFQPSNY